MLGEVAVAKMIAPFLVQTQDLLVDVDINHRMNYGVLISGSGQAQRVRSGFVYSMIWVENDLFACSQRELPLQFGDLVRRRILTTRRH